MKYTEMIKVEEKTQEERIFDLECQVSMLTELINELVNKK